MSELIKVTGADCLNYIDDDCGFASLIDYLGQSLSQESYWKEINTTYIKLSSNINAVLASSMNVYTNLLRVPKTGRIIGLVTKKYSDGGLQISIMGNGVITPGDFSTIALRSFFIGEGKYDHDLIEIGFYLDGVIQNFPLYTDEYSTENITETKGGCFNYTDQHGEEFISFDNIIDFNPAYSHQNKPFTRVWRLNNVDGYDAVVPYEINLDKTLDKLQFGVGVDYYSIFMDERFIGNPLAILSGDLYQFLTDVNFDFRSYLPQRVPDDIFPHFVASSGIECIDWNLSSIPFNIILTENEQFAKEYVDNGTLPPDAFLYPLDWNNLPQYTPDSTPSADKPDDFPDDNDPDDDDRNFDPTPPETPSYTVNQLTNYNWYWLTVPEWSAFISWFWNDIGDYSDFDDIIAKVKGLYNDVASAVIMCRYYPVDISWIGGLGTQSNIKLGMIEKAGAVDTISQATALHAVDIGYVHIGTKYKSFMDMSPYSQLSLYLPWHGFIDLDMNLFNGHDVYVKALYDYLSGTIQYYIYYDNELLVNTILCKMAMDIPITLQTKNDRDSAIFNNVSSTIGGLVGAGAGIISGNPIGMALGVTQGVGAFNSANASAPMRLMGNVGESGAYIGFQNCFVVVRRPTIQPSDGNSATMKGLSTWKKNVGMLCGYGYTLSDLSGQGFTVCHSPRIDFTSTTPLQTEVDEIYDYLEKGVIL